MTVEHLKLSAVNPVLPKALVIELLAVFKLNLIKNLEHIFRTAVIGYTVVETLPVKSWLFVLLFLLSIICIVMRQSF